MLINFYPRPPWGGRPEPVTRTHWWKLYFYPRPPWGGRRAAASGSLHRLGFLSTPSVGRATMPASRSGCPPKHFYPRPPWGGRLDPGASLVFTSDFYPRPPWGGRQPPCLRCNMQERRISIHALRGEGDAVLADFAGDLQISIHALRGEGDSAPRRERRRQLYFYPRPPWGGRHMAWAPPPWKAYFYPRPPWGGRPGSLAACRGGI